MKVLITGGAGFIGSHLADRLLARGDSVLAIDNYSTGRRDNLTDHANLTVVEGCISNAALVEEHFNAFKPDVVVHAAASYKHPDAWEEDSRTNAMGTAIIGQAAKRHDVGRLLYFQTALCYGLHPDHQPITLDHELRPKESSYAISKTAGEHYVALSGVEFLSFRLANAYGPRNLSGPLPTFYQRLTAGKKCFVMDTRRDFIYVQDLVDVVERAIDGKGEQGYYHISSGGDFSIQELFDAVTGALELKLDEPVEVRPRGEDDAYTILLDPSKTEKLFDWKIKTSLQDGVKAAVGYYQEFGIEETYTHLRHEDAET